MTTEPPFDFDGAIRTAKNQIANETVAHEKRMEFWKGYASAMEEVRDHDSQPPRNHAD